jgi:membrane protease YdiL (CAAX protease family)
LGNAVATAVAFEAGLAVVAIGIAALLGWPSPLAPAGRVDRSVGIQLVIGTLAALPMVVAFLLLERRPPGWFSDVRQEATHLAARLFRGAGVAQLLLVSAVAGIGEELLFRGLLIGSVSQGAGIGLPAALVLSSVIFGLAHPISRSYAVVAGAVGLYLGAIYLWSGGVLAPTVAHGLYDFVALWYLLRKKNDDEAPAPGDDDLDETEAAGRESPKEE